MSQRVFFLDLKNDPALIAEYERRHAPGSVWPDIVEDLRRQGFIEMQIWRASDRLVMIAEVSDHCVLDPRSPVQELAVQKWEAEMDVYQCRLPTTGSEAKWTPASCIFDLAAH